MSDDRDDRLFHRAAATLRAPGERDQEALADVLAALRGEPFGRADADADASRGLTFAARSRRRRGLTRSTVRYIAGLAAGMAFAAGLGLGIFAGWRMRGAAYRVVADDLGMGGRMARSVVAADTALGASLRPVQFMLVAPDARRVALVGAFNDWDPVATPMVRAPGGAWHVAFPLPRGRHVYAFVVDGSAWVPDPQAPLAPEGWYGVRNSVMLVDGGRSQ